MHVIKQLGNYFTHRISLIDIKGLRDFKQCNIAESLSNTHSSLGSLLRLALNTQKSAVSEEDLLEVELNTMQNMIVQKMLSDEPKSITFFSSNLLAECVELLFVCSLKF